VAKDTVFTKKKTLNCRGKLLDLSTPVVMGILNLTPDSFYDGGELNSIEAAIAKCAKMLSDGAAIIDIGAYSTRPGAEDITEEEELKRLLPYLKELVSNFPDAIFSVDTFRANVAEKSIENGAAIINDISGQPHPQPLSKGEGSKASMFEVVAAMGVPYILMHNKGTPQTMQQNLQEGKILNEVMFYFSERLNKLHHLGVNDIILDPGFGFGKTLEQNYELLREFDQFRIFDKPLLAGVSRKSMINKVLGTKPENALNGTTVLNTLLLEKGAAILRVHDVKEAVEAVKLVQQLSSAQP
jgi:dihydropteroate synthase